MRTIENIQKFQKPQHSVFFCGTKHSVSFITFCINMDASLAAHFSTRLSTTRFTHNYRFNFRRDYTKVFLDIHGIVEGVTYKTSRWWQVPQRDDGGKRKDHIAKEGTATGNKRRGRCASGNKRRGRCAWWMMELGVQRIMPRANNAYTAQTRAQAYISILTRWNSPIHLCAQQFEH